MRILQLAYLHSSPYRSQLAGPSLSNPPFTARRWPLISASCARQLQRVRSPRATWTKTTRCRDCAEHSTPSGRDTQSIKLILPQLQIPGRTSVGTQYLSRATKCGWCARSSGTEPTPVAPIAERESKDTDKPQPRFTVACSSDNIWVKHGRHSA